MFFDTNLKITDIIMFNSRNLGALIVNERPHVKSWDEPQYSIQNIAIEESYGFGVLNEGQAIAVASVKTHLAGYRRRRRSISCPACSLQLRLHRSQADFLPCSTRSTP